LIQTGFVSLNSLKAGLGDYFRFADHSSRVLSAMSSLQPRNMDEGG
jgi:hypothetical protein